MVHRSIEYKEVDAFVFDIIPTSTLATYFLYICCAPPKQQKTLLNCFNKVFDLVARAGFEPTTFGL
jgi:hypothetical protein